ncbi:unnamed protein product, partial [Brassica oleracea]
LPISSFSHCIEMRVALDFHGVSGGSKSARQGLSRHWSSSEMLQGGSFDSVHFQIWVRFGGRATWCGSGELLLALSFAVLHGLRSTSFSKRWSIVECLCIQSVWTEQRVPLVEFVKSLGLVWFGCRSGRYRVAGYRQQRYHGVDLSRPSMEFSCRFL